MKSMNNLITFLIREFGLRRLVDYPNLFVPLEGAGQA